MKKLFPILLVGLLLVLIGTGCRSKASNPESVAVTGGWTISAPEAQGMDPAPLARMFERIDQSPRHDVHSVLIIRNGVIVAEKYYQSYTENSQNTVYSVTKSVTSALVGIAIEEGSIQGVDQPVSDFFPEALAVNPDPRKSAMTLEDLLTMRAGLEWQEGNPAYRSLYMSQDWVAFMLNKVLEDDPGTKFEYCSGCTHVLSGVIQKATGMPTQDFARTRLFEPLGITNYRWETDSTGNTIGGWGLELTARDMAKFGTLFLQNGAWAGQQIIPASWVKKSTRDGIGAPGEWDYAYQWWVKADENLYAAQGMYGQKIYVVPDQELVVVVTVGSTGGSDVGDLVLRSAVEAVND